MLKNATPNHMQEIFPLIDTIWQEMDFPLRRLINPDEFQKTMVAYMRQPDAKYSYTNCWIYQEGQHVAGIVYGYYGKDEPTLDEHFFQYIEKRYPHLAIRQYQDLRESNDDEWYIDAIVVHPDYRKKGIGSTILNELPNVVNMNLPIGLNCDKQNPNAKKLYQRHGFETITTISFLGHEYDHMQCTAKQLLP